MSVTTILFMFFFRSAGSTPATSCPALALLLEGGE